MFQKFRPRFTGAAAVTVLLGLGLGAPASASAVEPEFKPSCERYASDGVRVAECVEQLRLARDATAKYRDPNVALRDGFVPGECDERPAVGAAGEHWSRVDRMADERLYPREPEILLYIDGPGRRRLVAAEWSMPALEGGLPHYGTQPPDPNRTPPPPRMFGGRAFDGPMQGHNLVQAWPYQPHLTPQPWHYDLHVWLWEQNPDGIFAHYNPALGCTGGPTAHLPTCGGRRATIVGTADNDVLTGTRNPDVIAALRGNDRLRGLGANDRVCAGRGRDAVLGGAGKDRLAGRKGNDRLFGGADDDRLKGGRGRDALIGGQGRDALMGGPGRDTRSQ